ncbi:MAG: oxidoreductase, partial [Acidimicrobiaceae bacterium]|nr:oxidoreductase [Acidimicrobiaceae bacterium]
ADDGASFETLTTLGAMAALTSRIRFGVLVSGVLYRDPATLAKSAAQLDQISGGRLEFSLGAAWAEREFLAYGFDYPALPERYARLDEALHIVKSLWTEHRTTFKGRYYSLDDAPCEPKPLQRPHPPIMVGGAGRGSLQTAAKHASSWNGMGSAERCAQSIERLRGFCEELGRDVAEIEFSWHGQLALASTHEQAEEQASAIAASHDQNRPKVWEGWLLGTPEEVVAQLRGFADIGISHWVIGIGDPYDTAPLRLLRDEVLPALA